LDVYNSGGTIETKIDSSGNLYMAGSEVATQSYVTTQLGSYLLLAGGTLTGALSGTSISTTGNISDGGTLSVTGTSALSSNTTVGGTLGVTGATSLATNGLVVGTTQLVVTNTNGSNAIVGIGMTAEAGATLDVAGQVHAQVYSNGSGTAIDWKNGNVQYTSAACNGVATQFTFSDMLEGGSYTLIVTGQTGSGGTCNFSTTGGTSVSPSGVTGWTFLPSNGVPSAGTSIYTMLRAGNVIYVSWITGFPAGS
jgi:hypothetical protein